MSPRSLWPLTLWCLAAICLAALSYPGRWADAALPPTFREGSPAPLITASQPTTQTVASILRSPIKPTYDPGDRITVTVRIENLADFYGGSLDWTFNANTLRVVDADPSRSGVQVTPGSIFVPGSFIAYPTGGQVDNVRGRISFAGTYINPMPPFNGIGDFVSITFEVKSTCGATLLELTPDTLKMSDRDGPPPITFQTTGPLVLSARYGYCVYLPHVMNSYSGD
ncbi:MAG: hypothetical protein KIT87_00940 [Anaerolineae bacterium]|nr:hypothetical protein [Anaerolineae bacterium]